MSDDDESGGEHAGALARDARVEHAPPTALKNALNENPFAALLNENAERRYAAPVCRAPRLGNGAAANCTPTLDPDEPLPLAVQVGRVLFSPRLPSG